MSDNTAISAFSVYKKEYSLNVKQEKKKRKHVPVKVLKEVKKQKFEKLQQNSVNLDYNLVSGEISQNLQLKLRAKQKLQKRKEKKTLNGNIRPKLETKLRTKQNLRDSKQNGKSTGIVHNEPKLAKRIAISPIKESVTPKIFNENLHGDDPRADALQVFSWMIAPLSPEIFFQTYWEQKVSYIKRPNQNYYRHIFNSSMLDEIMRNNRLYYTQNVDVVSYENGVKEVHNSEGRATAPALWDYYSNGCSIRILNPQTYNHRVHLLLATLQEYFGTMVGANAYLTPPNSQGFAPHYDDIEAFILQLEGQKHWKLYQPESNDVLARFSSPNLEHKNIGKPVLEVTLKAGDMLYFPRGTIHEGSTSDSHSLHITVSVYQQTSYADLLQHTLTQALQKASKNDVDFRKGLPLNYLKHFGVAAGSGISELRTTVEKKVESLMHKLVQYADVDGAADLLGKKFMYDSMPPVLSKEEVKRSAKGDGPCLKDGEVINKVTIDLNTRIRLLRYYCIRLVNENDPSPKLYYNTENANVYHGEDEQWLELDTTMISAIQMLQNTYPRYIKVDDLPMEDEIIKMQLTSDLWEHGLIVTEHPLLATD